MKRFKEINSEENSVKRWVMRWANARVRGGGYEGVEGPIADLLYGGCASGMVGELIYTDDCHRFYRRHAEDIASIIQEFEEETGASLHNKNNLDFLVFRTWAAIELAAIELESRER